MKHTWYVCDLEHDDGSDASCMFCAGGLSACTTCGGFEGTLPTHCPGAPMDAFTAQKVYTTNFDFVNGEWRRNPLGLSGQIGVSGLLSGLTRGEMDAVTGYFFDPTTPSMIREKATRGW